MYTEQDLEYFRKIGNRTTPCGKPYFVSNIYAWQDLPGCSNLINLHDWGEWITKLIDINNNYFIYLVEEELKKNGNM